jgi:hypothetical protein
VSGGPRDRHFGFLVRPEAEQLVADPGLLRRVLANLMANAIKHTRRGGYIDFRAWKQDDAFVLSVRDDGEGIPEVDQKRIFNAFEQSRHTVHDRYDTGMGLTFCKLAVEKHGGKIWVESKVGRGSTFYFTIPVDVAAPVSDDDVVIAVPERRGACRAPEAVPAGARVPSGRRASRGGGHRRGRRGAWPVRSWWRWWCCRSPRTPSSTPRRVTAGARELLAAAVRACAGWAWSRPHAPRSTAAASCRRRWPRPSAGAGAGGPRRAVAEL